MVCPWGKCLRCGYFVAYHGVSVGEVLPVRLLCHLSKRFSRNPLLLMLQTAVPCVSTVKKFGHTLWVQGRHGPGFLAGVQAHLASSRYWPIAPENTNRGARNVCWAVQTFPIAKCNHLSELTAVFLLHYISYRSPARFRDHRWFASSLLILLCCLGSRWPASQWSGPPCRPIIVDRDDC